MKPIIAVTTGDPFGIGPEISLKAAASPEVLAVCRPLLIGDREHLLRLARILPGGVGADPGAWPEVARSGFSEWGTKQGDATMVESWSEGAAIYDMADLPDVSIPGVSSGEAAAPSAEGGRAAVRYVKQSVALVRTGVAAALATAPFSKTALRLGGHDYPGHTELLADLCGVERGEVAMMFVAPGLKVALQTVHLGLKEAIASLSAPAIEAKIHLVRAEHLRWFGSDPRIALCALNPHGGEEGMFGQEEREILAPAVEAARREGAEARGPFPADTIFGRAARGEFDVVLALFHDQATIAVKGRSFGAAVNVTLGLPMLRTSADHGTAFDLAGRGIADHGSLLQAILLAAQLTVRPETPPSAPPAPPASARPETPAPGRSGGQSDGRSDGRS